MYGPETVVLFFSELIIVYKLWVCSLILLFVDEIVVVHSYFCYSHFIRFTFITHAEFENARDNYYIIIVIVCEHEDNTVEIFRLVMIFVGQIQLNIFLL